MQNCQSHSSSSSLLGPYVSWMPYITCVCQRCHLSSSKLERDWVMWSVTGDQWWGSESHRCDQEILHKSIAWLSVDHPGLAWLSWVSSCSKSSGQWLGLDCDCQRWDLRAEVVWKRSCRPHEQCWKSKGFDSTSLSASSYLWAYEEVIFGSSTKT